MPTHTALNLHQAKIRAKELKKSISKEFTTDLANRFKILPEYQNVSLEQILVTQPALKKCQNVIAIENGFESWHHMVDSLFWQSITESDFHAAIAVDRNLTPYGVNVYLDPDDTGEDWIEKEKEQRKELYDCFDEFILACRWLKAQKKRKTINKKKSSYKLKHIVEQWAYKECFDKGYVSNGAFIAAAIYMGFNYEYVNMESPNVFINISQKLVDPQ